MNSLSAVQPSSPLLSRLRSNGVLKNLSGNTATGECGMQFCIWNGDRARGWGFYCACGYCTPMRRSFNEGFDDLEKHWNDRRKK